MALAQGDLAAAQPPLPVPLSQASEVGGEQAEPFAGTGPGEAVRPDANGI